MPKFSANLGFLWNDLSLPDAIQAAARNGFDAVECHWPYEYDVAEVASALNKSGLTMLGVNTLRGFMGPTEFGVSAIAGREPEAQHYIDRAVGYCAAIQAKYIHVMAGITDHSAEAENAFLSNLNYACDRAEAFGLKILIEPINQTDVPDYHLHSLDHALKIQTDLDRDNLKIMFDCYHTQITHGHVLDLLKGNLPSIGHIQIASVPDRTEPDRGALDYLPIMAWLDDAGYTGYIGAEYKPHGTVEAGLSWMQAYS